MPPIFDTYAGLTATSGNRGNAMEILNTGIGNAFSFIFRSAFDHYEPPIRLPSMLYDPPGYPPRDEYAKQSHTAMPIRIEGLPARHPTKGFRRSHKNCRLGSR